MKKLFDPQVGQRVWNRSIDRPQDIFEIQQVITYEPHVRLWNQAPTARVYIRRPGRGQGPIIMIGPEGQPLAGDP